jgi:hypothetical protein
MAIPINIKKNTEATNEQFQTQTGFMSRKRGAV